MARLHACVALVLSLGLSLACASAPTTNGSVRVVGDSPIDAQPAATPAPSAPAEPGAGSPEAEAIEVVEPAYDTRSALEEAIALATEALETYTSGGDHDTVRETLRAARIVLLEADLPEVMQEQGLGFLRCVVPVHLRDHDLEALLRTLEAEHQAGEGELAEAAFVEREVRRILTAFGAQVPPEAELRIFLDEVTHYIDYYRDRGHAFFTRAYSRKHKYWPTIEEVFAAKRIPVELGYMAFVESGFNPRARSRANAMGLWQFIQSTGRRYGLRQRDDFHDVHKATIAASEYLTELIALFGREGFLLATAAYNAGEARIGNCLRKLDDPFEGRSFWAIRDCLARETREYVPRILAAAILGRDPARFGLDLLTEEEVGERYDIVIVPSPTSLATLARKAGTTVAELRAANSDLPSSFRSTPTRNFPLYVPKGGGQALAIALDPPTGGSTGRTDGDTPPGAPRITTPARTGEQPERMRYEIRSGDTLSEIASRYGVSSGELARWNRIDDPKRLRVGQHLNIYPSGQSPRIDYEVKRGNNLRLIAQIFGVSHRDIMRWNGLRSSRLQIGQHLEIRPPRPMREVRHRVARGESVGAIARRYGVPASEVLTANGLTGRAVIREGQRLVVYVPG